MKTILVCGDRNWTDDVKISEALYTVSQEAKCRLVHGACKGADSIAARIATSLGWPSIAFEADWDNYGTRAGPMRNRAMLDFGPDVVLAFHDNLSKSRGTKHMISIARKAGVPVHIFRSYAAP